MFGKINPRDLKRFMKQFGINFKEINAKEVIIVMDDKDIIIKNPNIIQTTFQGQKLYQIYGEEEIRAKETYSEEDIRFVAEQTNTSIEVAKKALKEAKGDIAKAILLIQEGKIKQ